MYFLLGSQNIDKTTCLIQLANQFIVNNNISAKNGYILLFTPPHSDTPLNNQTQIKKGYNFIQYFTRYAPQYKSNIDLIKCYTLDNFEKSCDLINNFRIISNENKGLKLILIDDITWIINPWVEEVIKKRKNKVKPEERQAFERDKNILLIYNQIFQYFLKLISLLQKSYNIDCFITINLDISDRIYFTKNAPRIFNAIFPFIQKTFYFHKSDEEEQIDFEEVKLILNMKTNKIEFCEINQKKDITDIKDTLLNEYFENNNFKINRKYEEWIINSIGDFVDNMNDFKRKIIERMKQQQEEHEEEDSSFTQQKK